MPSSLRGKDLLNDLALQRIAHWLSKPSVFSLNPFSGTVTAETFTRNKRLFVLINQAWRRAFNDPLSPHKHHHALADVARVPVREVRAERVLAARLGRHDREDRQ